MIKQNGSKLTYSNAKKQGEFWQVNTGFELNFMSPDQP